MSAPLVSVVIPHYRSPRSLALVLTALELQDHPMDRLEVVVADDGSPEAPDPGDRPYDVRVVRQEDLGFRGAAAGTWAREPPWGRSCCSSTRTPCPSRRTCVSWRRR